MNTEYKGGNFFIQLDLSEFLTAGRELDNRKLYQVASDSGCVDNAETIKKKSFGYPEGVRLIQAGLDQLAGSPSRKWTMKDDGELDYTAWSNREDRFCQYKAPIENKSINLVIPGIAPGYIESDYMALHGACVYQLVQDIKAQDFTTKLSYVKRNINGREIYTQIAIDLGEEPDLDSFSFITIYPGAYRGFALSLMDTIRQDGAIPDHGSTAPTLPIVEKYCYVFPSAKECNQKGLYTTEDIYIYMKQKLEKFMTEDSNE